MFTARILEMDQVHRWYIVLDDVTGLPKNSLAKTFYHINHIQKSRGGRFPLSSFSSVCMYFKWGGVGHLNKEETTSHRIGEETHMEGLLGLPEKDNFTVFLCDSQ